MDEAEPIVVAPGSAATLLGTAGDAAPRQVLPGSSLLQLCQHVEQRHRRAINVDGADVMVAAPLTLSNDDRCHVAEVLFEAGGANSLYLLPEPVAAAYAVGELGAVRIVDLGHSASRVSYVEAGQTARFFARGGLGTAATGHDECGSSFAASLCDARHGIPLMLSRLPMRSRGSPVVFCGGGASQSVCKALLSAVALADADDVGGAAAKVIVPPSSSMARSMTFLGCSALASTDFIRIAMSRAEYMDDGPRGIVAQCPQ